MTTKLVAATMETAIKTKVTRLDRFDFAKSVALANIADSAATIVKINSANGKNCILSTHPAVCDTLKYLLPKETILKCNEGAAETIKLSLDD